MAVSIRDVAASAEVSVGTVSKVLNDVPSRISPATRAHIREVAARLGYQPNRLARSLGRRRSDTIGLMVSGLQNPFFADLAETAERVLMEAGYQVFLEAAPSGHGTYTRHSKLRGWPVDGVLIWADAHESTADYLGPAADSLPAVYLGYPRPGEPSADVVAYDLYGGGRLLTEHLLARGHGRRRGLLCIAPIRAGGVQEPGAPLPAGEITNARLRAFLDVCRRESVRAEFLPLPNWEETREAGYALGEQIAARPPEERPDAVFCHNDVVAVGFYRALRRAGLKVPGDIAVAGFDDTREARYLDDPLTTVATPAAPMCRTAIDLLLERLRGDRGLEEGRQILLPATLVPGGTT
jgi:Transcriptional regulators